MWFVHNSHNRVCIIIHIILTKITFYYSKGNTISITNDNNIEYNKYSYYYTCKITILNKHL